MIEHYVNGRRVYTADEAATLRGEKVKAVQMRLFRAKVEPAGWINNRLAVYYPEQLGAVSTLSMASHRAYRLASAVESMAYRLGSAESERTLHAVLFSVYKNEEDGVQSERWSRACARRRRALLRLTAALRDLPMKEEK